MKTLTTRPVLGDLLAATFSVAHSVCANTAVDGVSAETITLAQFSKGIGDRISHRRSYSAKGQADDSKNETGLHFDIEEVANGVWYSGLALFDWLCLIDFVREVWSVLWSGFSKAFIYTGAVYSSITVIWYHALLVGLRRRILPNSTLKASYPGSQDLQNHIPDSVTPGSTGVVGLC